VRFTISVSVIRQSSGAQQVVLRSSFLVVRRGGLGSFSHGCGSLATARGSRLPAVSRSSHDDAHVNHRGPDLAVERPHKDPARNHYTEAHNADANDAANNVHERNLTTESHQPNNGVNQRRGLSMK